MVEEGPLAPADRRGCK